MSKTIYIRFGVPDVIIDKEFYEPGSEEEIQVGDLYLIGYELEDGRECNEEGEVLPST